MPNMELNWSQEPETSLILSKREKEERRTHTSMVENIWEWT